MYPIDEVDPPHNWDQPREQLPPLMRWAKETSDTTFASIDHLKRIRSLYYGNISLIDKGVGRILDTLDELGMAENTLVIFTSDHGELLGDHGAFQKSKPYEASMRIPFLMRLPGQVAPGKTTADRVNMLDIMPTALELAELDYPGENILPGACLLDQEGGGLAVSRDTFVVEHGAGPRRWLSLLRGPWKYNYYFEGGWRELFQLEDDPLEMHNLLLNEPDVHSLERSQSMHQQLIDWEMKNGFASSFSSSGDLIASPIDERPPSTTNNQYPTWVENLPPDELSKMESPGASTLNAMANEWTYSLEDLNLRAFKDGGGSF